MYSIRYISLSWAKCPRARLLPRNINYGEIFCMQMYAVLDSWGRQNGKIMAFSRNFLIN